MKRKFSINPQAYLNGRPGYVALIPGGEVIPGTEKLTYTECLDAANDIMKEKG